MGLWAPLCGMSLFASTTARSAAPPVASSGRAAAPAVAMVTAGPPPPCPSPTNHLGRGGGTSGGRPGRGGSGPARVTGGSRDCEVGIGEKV